MPKSVTGNIHKKKTKSGIRYYPYINIQVNGKNKPEYLGCSFATKKEATARLSNEITLRNSSPGVAHNSNILFADWVAMWLAEKEKLNKIQQVTLDNYRHSVERHIIPYFTAKKLRLSEIDWTVLERYMQEKAKTLCTSSLKCHRIVLSQALKSARKQTDFGFAHG